jgi:hypothetical protein
MTLDRYADLVDDDLILDVETRGIEPLTPALQRRCSAN